MLYISILDFSCLLNTGQLCPSISLYTYIYCSTFGAVIMLLSLAALKNKDMEAIFATLTDEQRVEALNSLYLKGMTTPKEELAFSSDKLVYVKPFVARLLEQTTKSQDLTTRLMTRHIVDELLKDIVDEIQASCSRTMLSIDRLSNDYGLRSLVGNNEEDYYYTSKVA